MSYENFIERIKNKDLLEKVLPVEKAINYIQKNMTIITSGFTPAGYPKVIPKALVQRIKKTGENLNLTLITGASVGDELDGELSRAGVLKKRYPYQTNNDIRKKINANEIEFEDIHLSKVGKMVADDIFGDIDIAIIEAVGIKEDGSIIPTTSVGISPHAVKYAKQIIIEINTTQPQELEGIHDILILNAPPNRQNIGLNTCGDRIGTTTIKCNLDKIVAIVHSDVPDAGKVFPKVEENTRKISELIIQFLNQELKRKKINQIPPLQSGVGGVANAVLEGLSKSNFTKLDCFTEVIQDSMIELIDHGKINMISGTALTLSNEVREKFYKNLNFYKSHCVLRPMEISNNISLINQLGVIAMNTAIEVDIYGHVNSTHVMGSKLMNGIGGSNDFARNADISIFTTASIAKGGLISSIVPMVSHVDHTEHDVDIIITEQGIADLRGLCPIKRAKTIIENCAHPSYKHRLYEYFEKSLVTTGCHEPHMLDKALSWHECFLKTGTMKLATK